MPYVTLPVGDDGPVIELLVGVSEERRQALNRVCFQPPQRVSIRAQLDTGSGVTGFHPDIPRQLNLTPVGEIGILPPSTGLTPHRCNQYAVSISLAHPDIELHFPTVLVIESIFAPPGGIQGLIGREVLADCLFVYDGQDKRFSLAF